MNKKTLKLEYQELMDKTNKLKLFIDSDSFNKLDENEKLLLFAQHGSMSSYASILVSRIILSTNK